METEGQSRQDLCDRLQVRTAKLHRRAERSGAVANILRGKASERLYGLYLRNLLPAYGALETGLEKHRAEPAFSRIADPALWRRDAIEEDLAALFGSRWEHRLPLIVQGQDYAARIGKAASGDGSLLIAHAYVRYLGDLSGGQILAKVLERCFELPRAGLKFHDFPEIEDLNDYKTAFRANLDKSASHFDCHEAILSEAEDAFSCNIALSEAVLFEVELAGGAQEALPPI